MPFTRCLIGPPPSTWAAATIFRRDNPRRPKPRPGNTATYDRARRGARTNGTRPRARGRTGRALSLSSGHRSRLALLPSGIVGVGAFRLDWYNEKSAINPSAYRYKLSTKGRPVYAGHIRVCVKPSFLASPQAERGHRAGPSLLDLSHHGRRSSNANSLCGRNSAGSRKSVRPFKGIFC